MFFEGIIFDLFGTIIPRPDREVHGEMMRDMGKLIGIEENEFRSLWLSLHDQKTTWNRGNTADLMLYTMAQAGIVPDYIVAEEMVELWREMTISHFHYFPDVIPGFKELKENGFRIGLLTNCGPNVPAIVEASEISPYLDGAVYSSRIGMRKPDFEVYHAACGEIGTSPERTVFVGDGDSGELPGAEKAGLRSIKIERGSIAGDYRLTEEPDWEPAIEDLNDIIEVVQSL
jgi:putative hydrolase of the HAD superfamily